MLFEQTLAKSIFKPWEGKYIEYAKLKALLREGDSSGGEDAPWTETDENRFCEEFLNVQIDKVADFHNATWESLKLRESTVKRNLQDIIEKENDEGEDKGETELRAAEAELDAIMSETKELKKFSNVNYTGFLKIGKKHDRKRGKSYQVRPILQVKLQQRPINPDNEYQALLDSLSELYNAVWGRLDRDHQLKSEGQSQSSNAGRYTAHKFWVHPDNMLEVKTYIHRRLPVFVYSQQGKRDLNLTQLDPTLSSLYLDNDQFQLYSDKVNQENGVTSLRVKWNGQLNDDPELTVDKKTTHEDGSSEESSFFIKEKYIQRFISGDFPAEKAVAKMERLGQRPEEIDAYKSAVADSQRFVDENKLQPLMRANYSRTVFQKPMEDSVKISIDTNLVFIREDTLDRMRPCRDPNDWHRKDLDNGDITYPFDKINSGEISRFPYAVLEIRLHGDGGRKQPEWVKELMASHLVHRAPRFSKFVHGVAVLFEDYVNNLPAWLTEVETDIRKDPETAFKEEEAAKARRAEDDFVVGSLRATLKSRPATYQPVISSPIGKSYLQNRKTSVSASVPSRLVHVLNSPPAPVVSEPTNTDDDDNAQDPAGQQGGRYGTFSSILPMFTASGQEQPRWRRDTPLPPGVTKPAKLLKDLGPVNVEPKVWLANERTFLKWQHICVLLGTLAVGLFTAAGEDTVGQYMGIAYIVIATFAGSWGIYLHRTRRTMIVQRSGKDFDNIIGPLVVSCALMVALILNFVFKYRAAIERLNANGAGNASFAQSPASYEPKEWKIELVETISAMGCSEFKNALQ